MTTPETVERAREFAEGTLGKQCIDSQDRAGFVVNALLIPYLLSAIRMYESGLRVQGGHRPGHGARAARTRWGRCGSSDLIGLDTLLAVSESLYEEFRDPPRSRRRCSTAWSRRACWAASPAAGSTTTRSNELGRGLTPRIDEWRAITRHCRRRASTRRSAGTTFDRLTCS